MDGAQLRAALADIPDGARDAWIDERLGTSEIPDDGPELPRGCVPYLPCPVDVILRMIELAPVGSDDVFVDVGSGLGRALVLTRLLTGAEVMGVEIQAELVERTRRMVDGVGATGVSVIHGDAIDASLALERGTVFFLYCPFSGPRLARWLVALEPWARLRAIRICTVDLPLPVRPWLEERVSEGPLSVWRSTCSSAH